MFACCTLIAGTLGRIVKAGAEIMWRLTTQKGPIHASS